MSNNGKLFTISNNFAIPSQSDKIIVPDLESNKKVKPKKNKKISKLDRIKRHLVNLILDSTSHGLPSVFRTERPIFKIMWFIFFLISTGFGGYMLTSSVLDFLDYNVVSHIDLVFEQPTQFPTVTIFFWYDDVHGNEFNLEDSFIGCYFDGWKDCNMTEIEKLYNSKTDEYYYKFNGGKNNNSNKIDIKMQKIAGINFGLYIDFFTGIPSNYGINSSFHGIYLSIHNSSLNPFSEYSFNVQPGFNTYFIIKKTFVSKLGPPYSSCKEGLLIPDDFDSLLYKYITANSSYRQKDCIDLCSAKYLIQKCNSTSGLSFINELWGKKTSPEMSRCYDEHFTELTDMDISSYCSPYCPLECDSLKYDIIVRTEQISNDSIINCMNDDYYMNHIKKFFPPGYNITADDLRNTLGSIAVYYDDLVYTKISQTPKTGIVDLISNMGGLLGLFIGVSFLSFGELFEILFEIIFILFEQNGSQITLRN